MEADDSRLMRGVIFGLLLALVTFWIPVGVIAYFTYLVVRN